MPPRVSGPSRSPPVERPVEPPVERSVEREVLYRSELVTLRENVCARTDPSLSAPRPPMPYHEVCFGQRGAWVRHVCGEALLVDAGSVHFFNRGEVHRVSHPFGCQDRNTGIELSDAALVDVTGGRGDVPFPRTHVAAGSRVAALHELVVRAARVALSASIALDEAVLELVRSALRGPGREVDRRTQVDVGAAARHGAMDATGTRAAAGATRAAARRHAALVLDVRNLIETAYDEDLTLARLAACVGASPYHLSRVFRARTGTSIHRALTARRLRAALARVVDGDEALADVAAATGFADRTHLSRSFREAFGLSPREFRRRGTLALARRLADLGLRGGRPDGHLDGRSDARPAGRRAG